MIYQCAQDTSVTDMNVDYMQNETYTDNKNKLQPISRLSSRVVEDQ
jgi:hypothetical protein